MAIKVRHTVSVQISADTDEKKRRFFTDDLVQTVETVELTKQVNEDLCIAASATTALSLGTLTAVKGLYLEVQGTLGADVFINGSATAIPLRPLKDATPASFAKLFMEADITAVTIQNLDGTDPLIGAYALFGDETA